MKTRNTLIGNILHYVRDNPGVSGSQVHFRFQLVGTRASITNSLGRLRRSGLIENRGSGGRYSKWYATESESADPQFVVLASMLLQELQKVPKVEREVLLARRLQNLLQK